ncbi:urease [Poseidonibacter lekithochrous]|nr:urease [Poseidonibacter lekithochrous]
MAKHITLTNSINLKSLSRFMQILDGSFPSGVFVHSFGLEPHIVKEKVKDIDSLKVYLENLIIDQYSKMEFVYIQKTYTYLAENRLFLLNKLDNEISSYLTYEYAKASKDIGYNYYIQIKDTINSSIVKEYFNLIKEEKSDANELIVLASYAYDLNIDIKDFIVMWTKKNLINIAATSIKISRIKPSDIQKMLFSFDELLENMDFNFDKKITNFNPLFEEVIFEHKTLEPKMFVT